MQNSVKRKKDEIQLFGEIDQLGIVQQNRNLTVRISGVWPIENLSKRMICTKFPGISWYKRITLFRPDHQTKWEFKKREPAK